MPARQHLLAHDLDLKVQAFSRWLLQVKRRSDRTVQVYVRVVRRALADQGESGTISAFRDVCKRWWPNNVPVAQAALVAWATFVGDTATAERLRNQPVPAKRPRKLGPKIPLTPVQLDGLHRAVSDLSDPIVRDVLLIVLRTGRRLVDVVRIERQAIYECWREMSGGQVGTLRYVSKGGKERYLSVRDSHGGDVCWTALNGLYQTKGGRWRRVADLLAPVKAGSAQQECTAANKLRLAFRSVCNTAGVAYGADGGAHPHLVRHTFADRIAKQVNGDPIKLMKAMGWSSIKTAQIYLDHPEAGMTGDVLAQVGPR